MKRLSPVLGTLLLTLGLVATGCAPDDAPEPAAGDAPAGTEQASFNFEGDFDGPLGLQLWSVRHQMQEDVTGTLQQVYDMGFREVELAGTYGMSPEAFRQKLDSVGLDATAMHAGYDLLGDSLESVLDQAETLGVDYVGVAWIPHEGSFTVEDARAAADDFNAWGEAAAQRGIQFFYHIHGYEFQPADDGTMPFDVIAEETDPEDVKFEMDVLWASRPGQDPAELLRAYPDRWALMHIKDLKEGASTSDHSGSAPAEEEVPVGEGQIDFPSVLQAAEEIGLARYYVEDETTDPLGNIPKSTAYIEQVTY